MTEQIKAEAYVRSQRPALLELTFGCDVIVDGIREDNPGCEYDVVVDSRKDEHGRIELGYFGHVHPDDFKIIGQPIQLNDWLAVLGSYNRAARIKNHQWGIEVTDDAVIIGDYKIILNLNTGQPATEADYLAFNDITRV